MRTESDIWVLESYEITRQINAVADKLLDLRYYAHKNTEPEVEAYRREWKACLGELRRILDGVVPVGVSGSGEGLLLDWEQ